jgi:hypothetical protein
MANGIVVVAASVQSGQLSFRNISGASLAGRGWLNR